MGRITVRKPSTMSDWWRVMDGNVCKGRHVYKRLAIEQANAIRRVRKKRASRQRQKASRHG